MNIESVDRGIFATRTRASSPDPTEQRTSHRRSSLRQSLQRAAEKPRPSSKTEFDLHDDVIGSVRSSRRYKASSSSSTLSGQGRPKRATATKKKESGSKVPSPRSPTKQKKWSFRSSTTSKQRKRSHGYMYDQTNGSEEQDDSHAGRIAFPVRLFDMLTDVEAQGQTSIVSWLSHGRALRVHDPDAFVTKILPLYFKQSKITSFQRQLNVYGFRRIVFGRDAGAYHHDCFLRSKRDLAFQITRVGIKNTGLRSTYLFQEEEPDFYSMTPIETSRLHPSHKETRSAEPNASPLTSIAPPPLFSSDKPLLERLVDMQLDVGDEDKNDERPGGRGRDLGQRGGDIVGCTCCLLPSGEISTARRCCGCQLAHSEGDRIFFEGESFYYMDSTLRDIKES
jgi:hypothetical protein